MADWAVAALYCFTRLEDLEDLRALLSADCTHSGIVGTLLLAPEGINGTIAGPKYALNQIVATLKALPGCGEMNIKYSTSAEQPFGRMKVRIKNEIVTMGVPGIDPSTQAGTYVPPQEWNALISESDVLLIDTRNDYEIAIGTFEGAINPDIGQFRDFPHWFDQWRSSVESQGRQPRVAMFCTGGIRCEKSTAYARANGVQEVYHLDGGILRYLEEIPEAESLWQGECFVFDERVSVAHGLKEGEHRLCRECGWPVKGDTPHECAK